MIISPRRHRRRGKNLESSVPPTTVVNRSYCEKHHRILFDNTREQEPSRRYEFSENENLVNSLESSTCSSRSRRVATTTSTSLSSTSSSSSSRVKSTTTNERKTKSGKRVDFPKEDQEEEEEACNHSESIDNRTITGFERLSMSTNNNELPRVVKPKDILKRPSTRKMMIYPPEGQKGEPMTLRKLRSKIQCRVNGNQDTGFRYKVYYLQTFISDKWLPLTKNNEDDDDSTD